jgi:hypothetical protein
MHLPVTTVRLASAATQAASSVCVPGWEPQNAETLRDRFASHSPCLCQRAEAVDHVDRQIDVIQRSVGPRTEDFAASQVHRDDLVTIATADNLGSRSLLGPIGGSSDHCDRLDPLGRSLPVPIRPHNKLQTQLI